jgi:hypothetical protein
VGLGRILPPWLHRNFTLFLGDNVPSSITPPLSPPWISSPTINYIYTQKNMKKKIKEEEEEDERRKRKRLKWMNDG